MSSPNQLKKAIFPLYAVLGFLFVIYSCSDSSSDSGKNGCHADSRELFSEKLLRTTFDIDDATEIEGKEGVAVDYKYKWDLNFSTDNHNVLYEYEIYFNFAFDCARESLESTWQTQNEQVYDDRDDYQEISGVGKKASYSGLGGGQLRVMAKGYIFFLTLNSHGTPQSQEAQAQDEYLWSTEYKIEKGKELAQSIIDKL